MTFEAVLDSSPSRELTRALVDGIVAIQRMQAAHEALQAALYAQLVHHTRAHVRDGADIAMRGLAMELGAAMRVSDATVQRRLSEAFTLVETFPEVHAALAMGEITKQHASIIVDAGGRLDGVAQRSYASRAVDVARVESPNRLRTLAGVLAEEEEPRSITERHREARSRRNVWVTPDSDGMAVLHALLPAVLADGIVDRLTRIARESQHTRSATDCSRDAVSSAPACVRAQHTMHHLRADLLADLLLTNSPESAPEHAAITARVAITIPVHTLVGLSDTGATLTGGAPIDADTAYALAATAPGWDRVFVNAERAEILAVDRYRPTEEQRRLLHARDQHCRAPGCNRPARQCDVDHSVAYEHGGRTSPSNLAHLCRRHHVNKHAHGWQIRHLDNGELEWTSPLGRTYIDRPTRTVAFTSTEPADAPF